MDISGKLVLHPTFKNTIDEIKKVNLTKTQGPFPKKSNFDFLTFPPNGKIRMVEKMGSINLSAKNGQEIAKKYIFSGYDESKLNYFSLEGNSYFTAHTYVVLDKKEYIPINYLTFYFYTKSKNITERSEYIKYSEDHSSDSNRDYVLDRTNFLNDWAIDNSVMFIDGPLIGGQMTSYTISLVNKLHKKSIIPIFFVKNSESNLVTDNVNELKNRFNSDMHWSYFMLDAGQRSNFVMYVDEHNPNNAKIFCYLKAFDLSPQRVEFHVDTYAHFKDHMQDIMDLVYYLLLVHGNKKNPQTRPIAIAEKYARDVLRVIDSYKLIKSSGLVPTMNQERFGG